ncbi:hypothetical protein [Desulforamulus ruminis]|uniref:Uncharacterized protein n=1 Tax=Desulforamulus ruminis (strain ATCC 23193 / DSM 2154 / NCIMB 8452 / DL) TaxID=696281 RepID=F6DM31_DESRL|nr:hypothetical protein [Desulforamulus ruminis]AEG59373.1 hypothetical protein Desru_1098 [Desulforamulus ruminis DSM 2154]
MALSSMPDFTFKHMEQPDKLVDSPAANKEKFDSRGNEIRNYINSSLVPEILQAKQQIQQIDNKGAESIPITDTGNHFTATNVEGALEELFTSVSDGKNQVAAAITDKGVPASGSDTFGQLAGKIGEINTGVTPAGTAVVGDVLSGKTFINSTGSTLTGTMPNRGAVSITPSASAQTIQAGYHNGSGQVAAVTFDASKVLTGSTIAGTPGTMPNRGAVSITPGTTNQTIQAGYHSGSGVVQGSPNLLPANIRNGVDIFGVIGNLAGVKLKSIQVIPVSNLFGRYQTAAVTIPTAVDTTKAFILNNVISSERSAPLHGCTAYFRDSTVIELERGSIENSIFYGTGNIYVVEFSEGVTVQSGYSTTNPTITAVDTSKSFIITSTCVKAGSSQVNTADIECNAYFYSPTELRFGRYSEPWKRAWFVVSFT